MKTAIEIVQRWQELLQKGDFQSINTVVDVVGYTENCLGLTGWTTGYDIASKNYIKNMVEPWSDVKTTVEDVIANDKAVVTRIHNEATHVGTFLGIPPTGRRISWDAILIVQVKNEHVVGQWAQSDLWGIYNQLTEK
jgi:predicted ester cyclase